MRPKKEKCVDFYPESTFFKPAGIPIKNLEQIHLIGEELETLRLANLEGKSQMEIAEKMGVHQSTVQRLLKSARIKLTDALVNGKAIRLDGGKNNE